MGHSNGLSLPGLKGGSEPHGVGVWSERSFHPGIENPGGDANNSGAVLHMNLDEAQTARVREWIEQGLKVADIQTLLAQELGIHLTYMDARLLLDDLKLRPKDPPPSAAPAGSVLTTGVGAPVSTAGVASPPGNRPTGNNKVSVAVDNIARPGALVSGKVTFRDGQSADWQLDQFGRLAVIPGKQGYKPQQSDVAEFQAELDAVLARMGY
jgi:hypothetical protein